MRVRAAQHLSSVTDVATRGQHADMWLPHRVGLHEHSMPACSEDYVQDRVHNIGAEHV